MRIESVDRVELMKDGMVIKSGENEVFLSWSVIDEIGEASEPHYFSQAVREVAIMNSQKKLN